MPTSADTEGRRARKRRQTADRLAETAFALFAEHGYEAVTMEQIAAAADVAKGTLYNHFPVKEALLAHRFHADLAAALPALYAQLAALPSAVERLRAFLLASAAYSESTRDTLGAYLHYRLSQPVESLGRDQRSGLDQVFARLIGEAQASGEIRSELPLQALADMLQFMHLGTVMRWLHTPGASLASDFEAMLDLFLDGARRKA
ncbi:MAG: TetR/AcrR family transcriptional regulator [Rhodocyclales bacterium]|nr:TetR/AcrR family transcriptional regulator [Rhodocyclales bacterium]